ncbi:MULTISPECIES: hypothetical protein [Azospirillum]|jgi:hypothetical protein|uniref:Uncharacterized protein n=2 Tax=Azospirillum brasilense TaxID=192 RepID=A0ABU4P3U1_AZOBR|nr:MULTISPECIES: hypothetical protein [Azospirillum]MDW7557792.1 hypothetical protein [Azospirillum brasilense]MDW7597426.1 hypothetical protein [Azospirillum brasilense]MDW7632689.1 hypothetical protein [Azospirillum brasilense]MDX5952432.1 hypothetical protein [Azospirillum brasilense]
MAKNRKPNTLDDVTFTEQLPAPTEEQFMSYLKQLQVEVARLYSGRTQEFMEVQSSQARQRFVKMRRDLSLLVDAMAQKAFDKLAESLEENDEDLSAAISNLKREREKLEDAVKIIDTIASLLSIIARIIALA